MTKIGCVTCKDYPDFQKDELFLAEALKPLKIEAMPVIWEDAAAGKLDLNELDLILFRSCWNYHYHAEAFEAWLKQLEKQATPVWNPVALIRWNLDKRYLLQLQAAGVTIVPTIFTEPGDLSWQAQAAEQDWPELVIKPIVSAWGANTFRIQQKELPTLSEKMSSHAQTTGLMLQPFVPEIADGEWSLVYYRTPDGVNFSHAFVKKPASGAFLSHEEFGAHWSAAEAPAFMRQTGKQSLNCLPYDWLYARVDGVVVKDSFWVMELEVFEPSLYLGASPEAAQHFAQALATRLA
jgi:glutathione synthase/RimK-type ligase-like ATP-grasp enzyme